MRAISLFSGAGGMDFGFKKAGFKIIENIGLKSFVMENVKPLAAVAKFSRFLR